MLIYGEKKIRFRDREGPPPSIGHSFSGEVKCILYDENMNILLETEYQKNVITNQGMNLLRTITFGSPCSYMYIGSSATAAAFTDTQMGAILTYSITTATGSDSVVVQPMSPNYEYSGTRARRFGASGSTQTVREVGMGGNTSGTQLVCRQVLLSPITKGPTQSLDVIWRWTVWPEIADKTGVMTIGAVDYNYILRPLGLADVRTSFATSPLQGMFGRFAIHHTNDADFAAYDQDIATMLTGVPAGNRKYSGDTVTEAPYTPGTFDSFGVGTCSVDFTVHAGLTAYNISSLLGIRSVTATTYQSKYQCQFNAVSGGGRIPKTDQNELDLNYRFSWSRHGL